MNPYEIEDFFHSIYGVERAWGTPGMLDDFYARAAPDYVYHRPPFPPVHGIEANRKANEDMHKAFSNQKIIIDELAVCEDTAVLRYTWEGVHTGISPTLGILPTGKHLSATGCAVFHFVEGVIVEQWDYMDLLGLLQQAGVIPAMA